MNQHNLNREIKGRADSHYSAFPDSAMTAVAYPNSNSVNSVFFYLVCKFFPVFLLIVNEITDHDEEFCSIVHFEFLKNIIDMISHGFDRNIKFVCNLLVAPSFYH